MKSSHSNRKSLFGNNHVTDDVIILDVTWQDILWQMIPCCGLTVFCVLNCQSCKAFKKKMPQRILRDFL